MLEVGIIELLNLEWVLLFVFVWKKDGKVRWCIDYWKLNFVMKKDVYLLFFIEECIDILFGNEWFLKLDVNLVYY